MRQRCVALALFAILGLAGMARAENGTWLLSDYGPIGTPAQAEATLQKAAGEIIANGGGTLIIPLEAPAEWQPENISQGTWRKPLAPAPAKNWGNGPGVTILDCRGGTLKTLVPEMTGYTFSRTLRLPPGESCGHWGYFPLLTLENNIVHGSANYTGRLSTDVTAGKDRRCYVRTINGLFPGLFLDCDDAKGRQRLCVKSLGYDALKKSPYFVADCARDISAAHAMLSKKDHTNGLDMTTNLNAENQTFDVYIDRHHYSQGDAYIFAGHFNYLGDNGTSNPDAGSVIYAAESRSETNIFRGKVEAFNVLTHELQFRDGVNAQTLASGRPLIDLNPRKWITGGKLYLLNPGGALLGWGGQVRSKDAPWTRDVVGRYIAIDQPDEYVPGGDQVRRWFLITSFTEDNGLKTLSVQHHWWGAKDVGSISRLYNPRNFSASDDRPQLLSYIIAPGANVYDVADGVQSTEPSGAFTRTVKVAPGAHSGTPVDFAPGDPLEQAIGPEPFKPIPFRSWLFEAVPGAFPSPVFDVANNGPVSRYAVMRVTGGSSAYADYQDPKKPLPQLPFNEIINVSAACDNGIVFNGDVGNAAILFKQAHNTATNERMQAIRWEYPRASLGVTAQGTLTMAGAPLDIAGKGLSEVQSLAAPNATAGTNLRGLHIPAPAGTKSLSITFPTPEPTADYVVIVQPSWMTAQAITLQTAKGFTVTFNTSAPANAAVNWLLVR